MTCAWCREALSALLDEEDRQGERARVDAHLEHCGACRHFAARAARVTRLARTEPVQPLPDLVPAIAEATAAVRQPRRRGLPIRRGHLITVLRVVLAMLGLGQLGLATRDMFGQPGSSHPPGNLSGASITQLVHESSAWNLALAVGFLCVAAKPSRTRALVPLVSAFVVGLAALSTVDLADGRVIGSRLASHSVVVLGLCVLLVLARLARQPIGGAPDALGRAGWSERAMLNGPAALREHPRQVGPWRTGEQDLKPSAGTHGHPNRRDAA
jgi:predicted anti-sigma-YlaC factor YlaD